MAGNALPLLALVGAAVVLGSKKKKKKKTDDTLPSGTEDYIPPAGTPTTTTPGPTTQLPTTPIPSPYGVSTLPAMPVPTPKPKPTASKIPAGSPPNPAGPGEWGNYDHGYWDSAAKIKEIFKELGYAVPTRDTMNDPGPNKKLGGDDDIKSLEVEKFQDEYNAVSRSKTFASGMNGLASDGFVGPKVLNGLKFVIDNLNGKKWRTDVVKTASDKGFKA